MSIKQCLTTLCVVLFTNLFTPSANAGEAYPTPRFIGDETQLGRGVQRTMSLLASSTPEQRNTVRVLFYGQSITSQDWSRQVAEDLRKRFPNANLIIENRAIGGHSSQLLVKTAEADLYPFQPDLVILHVYGSHIEYEKIIRGIRKRTTAEILIQNDHVNKVADLTEEMDQAKIGFDKWDSFMNHKFLPATASKYNTGFLDQRAAWKRYLADFELVPSDLLRDGVHLNDHGCFVMAQLVNAYLRVNPAVDDGSWKDWVRTFKTGDDVNWEKDHLVLEFEGDRIDAVAAPEIADADALEVWIDGKCPSDIPRLRTFSRVSAENTVILAQGLGAGPHHLKLHGTSAANLAALRVYRPPGMVATTAERLHRSDSFSGGHLDSKKGTCTTGNVRASCVLSIEEGGGEDNEFDDFFLSERICVEQNDETRTEAPLAFDPSIPAPSPKIPWDIDALSAAPKWTFLKRPRAESARAISFGGLPFQGKPTRVFAWLGIPPVKEGEKVPAMVLVHGGGGTAFDEWVRLWVVRGYAAIAVDTCGQVPVGNYGQWVRDEQGGPPGWGGFDQIDRAQADQWTYHAVADVILAHSLIRSLPEVDSERTGVTGISWGGYLTCITAGVDPRFKLAVPVYGCGFYRDTVFARDLERLAPGDAERWLSWWDPSAYLGNVNLPMLWVTGSNDFAYPLSALQASYRLPRGPRSLCIRLRMPHGHGGAGENPEEIRAFADSILKSGRQLPSITGSGHEGDEAWATFSSSVPIGKAELNFTRDVGRWQDRKWETVSAKLSAERVTASLPEGTRVYYFNLFDERSCVVSTEHRVLSLSGTRE